MSNPNHLRLTKLALATGFRRSELLSLTWRNIDLKKRVIYIHRKNCAAIDDSSVLRLVPLPEQAEKILEESNERNGKVIELSKRLQEMDSIKPEKGPGFKLSDFMT